MKKTIPEIPPSSPRQWLAMVRDIFGANYIANLFGVCGRSVTKWIAQRPYVSEDSIRENPLEHFETLLNRLMRDGYQDIARAIISRFSDITECHLVKNISATPDKESIEAEMLDDYPGLTKLHSAILNGMDIHTIINMAQREKEEIDETVELYRQKQRQ